jgi:hypothetical protein
VNTHSYIHMWFVCVAYNFFFLNLSPYFLFHFLKFNYSLHVLASTFRRFHIEEINVYENMYKEIVFLLSFANAFVYKFRWLMICYSFYMFPYTILPSDSKFKGNESSCEIFSSSCYNVNSTCCLKCLLLLKFKF